MKKLLFMGISFLPLVLICISLPSCTDEPGAKKALQDAGYHPIKVGGYGWCDCSEDDAYATKFTAYSPDSSHIVKGTVCAGLLKGKTIRLD